MPRTDCGERIIAATRPVIFSALTDAKAVAIWRAPAGMHGEVELFEARPGGRIRMTLHYDTPDHAIAGKTSDHADAFEGRFLDIEQDRKVIEEVTFRSDDPAFAEPMIVETRLEDVDGGTRVEMILSNVPDVISREDHAKGIASSLENLARYVE